VHYRNNGLLLTQSKYIYFIIDHAKIQGAKHNVTLMATGKAMSRYDGSQMDDVQLYRSIVDALQYMTIARPEISFAVNRVSQFMHSPTSIHREAAKRILRYLKDTIDYGIAIKSASSLTITAFADSD
jgi:hypothetical protein